MALQYLGIDPATDNNQCPTIYYDEATDEFLVQGWKVTDVERLSQLTMDDRESVVRIPHRMIQFFGRADRHGRS